MLIVLLPVLAASILVAGWPANDGGGPTSQQRRLRIAGYVAPWDPRSQVALDRPPSPVRELSPVWYQPTPAGGVTFASSQARADASAVPAGLEAKGVRLVPSVSNFRNGTWDAALVSSILHDGNLRRQHVDALVAIARRPHVAGVDIDYESLAPGDQAGYTRFIDELAGALHRNDDVLTVAVHAKTGQDSSTPGAGAQEWRRIGAAADEVRIMAYDHAWPGSPPGPIAPLPWVEDVLRFAVSQVPRNKIVLGVPVYGYDWPAGQTGRDISWADAAATIDRSAPGIERWDSRNASPSLHYTDDQGHPHTVWYENARSVQPKLDLAVRYRVGGVFIWKLGDEDPAIWPIVGHGP